MDNWLANIVGDMDSLHVEIDNLNNPLVGFCFIRSIDNPRRKYYAKNIFLSGIFIFQIFLLS
jgi:hypothetical protein